MIINMIKRPVANPIANRTTPNIAKDTANSIQEIRLNFLLYLTASMTETSVINMPTKFKMLSNTISFTPYDFTNEYKI